jgi:predicted kinase
VSRAIAKVLQCPVVDKDDIRDCSMDLECPCVMACTCESKTFNFTSHKLNTLSYVVMWRVTETQLELGLDVVVDCPLERPGLFDRAVALARKFAAQLVVVECYSGDKAIWKERLESRAELGMSDDQTFVTRPSLGDEKDFYHVEVDRPPRVMSLDSTDLPQLAAKKLGAEIDGTKKPVVLDVGFGGPTAPPSKRWHKPAQWSDIEKILEKYEGCFEYPTGDTKKIMVDTTAVPTEAASAAVLQWLARLDRVTDLVTYFPPSSSPTTTSTA